jgi:hypothetical protein
VAVADRDQPTLTDDERMGITLAVQSAFTKLKNLYREIVPIFESYGFKAPSPGVIARDLSEKIEASIIQHCASFSKGLKHCDLSRGDHDWEVKICKDSGLTINQSKQIAGENYIVVNYKANTQVTRIFVLWDATEEFFSERRANSNARGMLASVAHANIDVLYAAKPAKQSLDVLRSGRLDFDERVRRGTSRVETSERSKTMAKAVIPARRRPKTA